MDQYSDITDRIALIDLDGTVADYDKSMSAWQAKLAAPDEAVRYSRMDHEVPHIEVRRKLVQRLPGFWRDLEPIALGMAVVEELRAAKFGLHILTQGPTSTPSAWGEKVEWQMKHLPDAAITVGRDKSLVYGRILFDDFPPYFLKWAAARPRGQVICLAHPWNEGYAVGGSCQHDRVFRYDGTNHEELRKVIRAAYDRPAGR